MKLNRNQILILQAMKNRRTYPDIATLATYIKRGVKATSNAVTIMASAGLIQISKTALSITPKGSRTLYLNENQAVTRKQYSESTRGANTTKPAEEAAKAISTAVTNIDLEVLPSKAQSSAQPDPQEVTEKRNTDRI